MPTAQDRQRRRVTRYYRWLDRLAFLRELRGQSGSQAQPVHRQLKDPAGGQPSAMLVHRLMLEGLALPAAPRVLDAGCGYGATALDLLPTVGGDWLGVTLSPVQIARGQAEAERRGLGAQLTFALQSYDDPLPGGFDLVIGIESLIHSADPARTIANLASALRPGGRLVMVDDMPEPDLPPATQAQLALFKAMWRCPVAPTRSGWLAALQAAGLELEREADLTPLTMPRSAEALATPLVRQRRRAWWLGWLGLGVREEADIGGMTLETLLREGAVRYRLLVARKPELPAPAVAEPASAAAMATSD
jgi:SAM-dependent methyltransferase